MAELESDKASSSVSHDSSELAMNFTFFFSFFCLAFGFLFEEEGSMLDGVAIFSFDKSDVLGCSFYKIFFFLPKLSLLFSEDNSPDSLIVCSERVSKPLELSPISFSPFLRTFEELF